MNTEPEFFQLKCPRCGAPLQSMEEVITCTYCGAKLILRRTAQPRQPQAPPTIPGPNGVQFAPLGYTDGYTGMEAFTMLIPVGWQVRGGIIWPMRAAAPAAVDFTLYNPDGVEQIQFFPHPHFGYTSDPMTQMSIPMGGQYLQSEFFPPMPAGQAFQQLLLPRLRSGAQNLQITSIQPDQEVAQAAAKDLPAPSMPNQQFSVDGIRAQVRFTDNDQPISEEFSVGVVYHRIVQGGFMGYVETVFWYTSVLMATRCRPGEEGQWAPVFKQMIDSFKTNPQFLGQVQRISQQLTAGAVAQINQAGQAAIRIGKTLSETSDIIWQGYQERSARMDHVHENFSQAIRGTEYWQDPYSGRPVEMPYGYNQAWCNPLGEYILSDDPLYDPNVGSTGNWTRMNRPND